MVTFWITSGITHPLRLELARDAPLRPAGEPELLGVDYLVPQDGLLARSPTLVHIDIL